MTSTREQMLACVDREIKMREKAYPEKVKLGNMTASRAAHELAVMRDVREVVAALPVEPEPQTDLFGGSK